MIKNFTFQSPTRIIFGKGAVGALKREIPDDKRILLLYGCSSLKKYGAYDSIKKALADRPEVYEFSGITSDPEYDYLLKCIDY
ncbi:MAG: iron-containing alcohol dehydrogenase, partial [Candidatus Riflebacteria bacterium]|nr:iron-containing alcohol dehydrogenase [Candidatus Riflebacteria bacterium]